VHARDFLALRFARAEQGIGEGLEFQGVVLLMPRKVVVPRGDIAPTGKSGIAYFPVFRPIGAMNDSSSRFFVGFPVKRGHAVVPASVRFTDMESPYTV